MRNVSVALLVTLFTATGAVTAHAATNLIANGNFGTGDFTDWTAVDVSYPIYVTTSPTEGGSVYSAQIAGYTYGPDTLSQSVTDTSGTSYTLSFGVYQAPPNLSASDISFVVDWNGASVFTQPNPSGIGWQNYALLVTGTGSDTLSFAAANNPGLTFLDNVSLSGVPEPSTWAMLLFGFGGLGFAGYRASRKSAALAM